MLRENPVVTPAGSASRKESKPAALQLPKPNASASLVPALARAQSAYRVVLRCTFGTRPVEGSPI